MLVQATPSYALGPLGTQPGLTWSLLICTRAAPCTETGYRGPAMAVASRLQTPEMGEDPSASLCLRGLWGTQKTVWDRIWQCLKPVGPLWSRPSLVLCSFLAVSQAHDLGAGAQGLGDFQAELLGGRRMSFPALEACKTEEGAEGRRNCCLGPSCLPLATGGGRRQG